MTQSFAEGLRTDLLRHRDHTVDLVPVHRRVLTWLADAVQGELGARLAQVWAERSFHVFYERTLLLLAGLRYDALLHGPEHPLHAALAAEPLRLEAARDDLLWAAVAPDRRAFYAALADRRVQTNETSRAVAWLWPAHLLSRAGVTGPLSLVDLGTSAGLNLVGDDLPALWSDADDQPLTISPRPPVAARLGLDVSPLDVTRADDALWLRACLWPGQTERKARLDAAIASFQAMRAAAPADERPQVRACPMDEAHAVLATLPQEHVALCMQTIVRDYLPPDVREAHAAAMRRWLHDRAPRRALYIELEVEQGQPPERFAVLRVSYIDRTGAPREQILAHTHPHPRKLFVDESQVAAFVEAFA